jgi:translation initiation factor 1
MAEQTKNSTLVYSTETGRICPGCGRPVEGCRCAKGKKPVNRDRGDGRVRIAYATKGRRGKGVTLVTGLPEDSDGGLKALARKLKQRCGTGGTVKGGTIEIQGDQREILLAELKSMGKM